MGKNTFISLLPAIICLLIFTSLLPENALSANLSISPTRVFFDGQRKIDILTLKNASEEELTLQLRAYKWEQDKEVKNVYSPTKDIIFFPKIFRIPQGEERLVRIGTKIPPGKHEKTYRLYIEEVPAPRSVETTAVRILLRIGVPIFISPLKTEAKAVIEKAALIKGRLLFTLKNQGNSHFIIKTVKVKGTDAEGKETFNTEIGGWYLLGGNSKVFTVDLPADNCPNTKTLNIDINTDKLSLNEKLDISTEMCAP
ncbi:MAG TPA: molecular chaperone [Nitrospirae bacterium]|nr:hypothetical protein BMS3Bbin08_01817 [bacterium BMS3Bbin08]HDK80972.1 molecular chaperone [Nitrospirota bacterium]